LHPEDLLGLVLKQLEDKRTKGSRDNRTTFSRIFNVSGGIASAMSLKELSDWCAKDFGSREVAADLAPRPFDLPWVVLDAARAEEFWDWKPRRTVQSICSEIAQHARENPEWLAISRG
jgi:CDP-paratose 2-epimerase